MTIQNFFHQRRADIQDTMVFE